MITLEHDIRFSQANMWRNQRDYYHEKGINAWHKDVPSYITSNPYIAKHYAQMVITFIEEWVKQHPEGAQEPFLNKSYNHLRIVFCNIGIAGDIRRHVLVPGVNAFLVIIITLIAPHIGLRKSNIMLKGNHYFLPIINLPRCLRCACMAKRCASSRTS